MCEYSSTVPVGWCCRPGWGYTPKWAGKVRCTCEAIKFLFLFLWTFGSAECMVSLNFVYREGKKCQYGSLTCKEKGGRDYFVHFILH